ncbi:hypothetical protein MHY1_00175 [Methylovirgula sp. HY1]|nr:hypothetical protein MHY1_00175 [Methylovirgula sp. HY1]
MVMGRYVDAAAYADATSNATPNRFGHGKRTADRHVELVRRPKKFGGVRCRSSRHKRAERRGGRD